MVVVQLVERLIWDQEDFAGSSPAYHTEEYLGQWQRWSMRRTENP